MEGYQGGKTVGFLHSVESFGSVDGPGVRYVLFLQGCPLRCQYCHNPDTWAAQGAQGKRVTAKEALADIAQYRSFIQNGGVTLSGGEPLLQSAFCRAVLEGCRAMGLHTALDTSGVIPLEVCWEAVEKADLLLLDIKAIEERLCKRLTGQDNRNALRLLDECERTKKTVWIRHVIVPGVTALPEQLEPLARYLADFSCVERVELLPFHQLGRFKWEALGLPYALAKTPEPTQGEMAKARAIFARWGLPLAE